MTISAAEAERETVALGLTLLDTDPAQVEAMYLEASNGERELVDAALTHPAVMAHAEGRRYVNDPAGWIGTRLREFVWSKQREVAEALRDHRQVAVPSSHGVGKALSLDTPLPTPTGWTTAGAVQAGERLLDERGRACTVVAAREWDDRPCYRVAFDDGTSVVADAEHEWAISRFHGRATQRKAAGVDDWRHEWDLTAPVTTKALAGLLRTSYGQRDAAVPLAGALTLPEATLPVDPYLLGVYLAEGTRADGGITLGKQDAPWIEPKLGLSHRVPSADRPTSCVVRVLGLKVALAGIGALDPKRIPVAYLRASLGQRTALLHGIMDGDGFARGASAGVDFMAEGLAADVVELMRSLGLRPTVRTGRTYLNGRNAGTRWRISVTPTIPVFSLPRKLREHPDSQRCRYTQRMVTAVEPVEHQATRCVEVDSPSHLYLCGEAMVPTHNSWLAARLTAWWIETHPPGTAFVVTTAPTSDQVRGVLWRELRRAHARGSLPGRINLAQWYVAEELVAIGRKPSDQNAAAFQGVHAEFVLVIIDEADGVAAPIFDAAADTLATTEESRVLAIGNPDRSAGPFFAACQPGSDWHVVRISAFDTPTFTGEKVPDRVGRVLVSKSWVEERRRKWGESDPRWSAKVLGVAPLDKPTGVIPWSALVATIGHDPDDGRVPVLRRDDGRLLGYRWGDLPDQPRWGVDVAAGGDKTVVWERRGRFLCRRWTIRTDDADLQVAGMRSRAAEWGRPETINVDATGLGWGLLAPLRREAADPNSPLHGARIEGVQFGGAGSPPSAEGDGTDGEGSPGFSNVRAELWWNGRTLATEDGWDLRTLASPEHDGDLKDEVVGELADPSWDALGAGGRIRVEAKDHTKQRLGRSPDDADAILLAFWEAPMIVATATSAAGMEGAGFRPRFG